MQLQKVTSYSNRTSALRSVELQQLQRFLVLSRSRVAAVAAVAESPAGLSEDVSTVHTNYQPRVASQIRELL